MISSKLTKPEKTKPSYPYLGESDGLVVLFVGTNKGNVLIGAGIYNVGDYSKAWAECDFKPLVGKITLSNE